MGAEEIGARHFRRQCILAAEKCQAENGLTFQEPVPYG